MVCGAGEAVAAYPIIGFANIGGTPRFRAWDGSAFQDLAASPQADTWHTTAIRMTRQSSTETKIEFLIDGAVQLDQVTNAPSIINIIMNT